MQQHLQVSDSFVLRAAGPNEQLPMQQGLTDLPNELFRDKEHSVVMKHGSICHFSHNKVVCTRDKALHCQPSRTDTKDPVHYSSHQLLWC